MVLIGTWIDEEDLKKAEEVLRLDCKIEGDVELYAVFSNEEGNWLQASEWMPFEQAMEDLQGLTYIYLGAEPKVYVEGLSTLWQYAFNATLKMAQEVSYVRPE